jgi:hypothetical protein
VSDADLRLLERDALASGDSLSWKRFYAARRRTGWGQPSGEATWAVPLPTVDAGGEHSYENTRAYEGEEHLGRLYCLYCGDGGLGLHERPCPGRRVTLLGLSFERPGWARRADGIELEWRRCGTIIAVRVEADAFSAISIPWWDCLRYSTTGEYSIGIDINLKEPVLKVVVRAPEFLDDLIVRFAAYVSESAAWVKGVRA